MNNHRRATAVVLAASLLGVAGCWNPAPEKYPSITFFGADMGTITSGTDGAGNSVQGSVTLTWQTRLAEKVNIVATSVATGDSTTVATFAAGATSGCTVNPQFPNSDCAKDGTLAVSPTEDTIYNIQAIIGAGDCSRDPTLGNLLHPDQCNDLTDDPNASLTVIQIGVVAPSTVSLTIGGSDSTTVAPGADVAATYAVTGATAFDFGLLGTDASGNPTYDACGAQGDGSPCYLPPADADGNVPTSGQITIPGVTASTVLTGESTNGADDGLGDVSPDTTGATVTINVVGAPTVGTFTATPDHIQSGATVTLAWTVTGADSVAIVPSPAAAADTSACTGVDASGMGTCAVAVSGAAGAVTFTLTATDSTTSQTGTGAATVTIGTPPGATLQASPADIASGTDVVLTWTAAGADSVTIMDGSGTIVDTSAATPTTCDSGNACVAAGDTFTVTNVTATTQWTLTATNAFGTNTASAASTVHAAAAITSVGVDTQFALGATPVTVSADTATVTWTSTNVSGGTLEVAPASAATTLDDCTTVPGANWGSVGGFTWVSSGSFQLTGLSVDRCYRLTATSYGTQASDVKVFEVKRKVAVATFTVNGTAALSGTATVTTGTSAALVWTGTNAGSYQLFVAAKGAATQCTSATYGAAIQASSATSDGSYTIAAVAAETCVKLAVAHPQDATRVDTIFVDITAN